MTVSHQEAREYQWLLRKLKDAATEEQKAKSKQKLAAWMTAHPAAAKELLLSTLEGKTEVTVKIKGRWIGEVFP